MVYASYAKCPHIGGRVASANLDEVKALAGVIDAFIIEGQAGPYQFDIRNSTQVSPGVAIVACDTWAAMRARKALEVQWDTQTRLCRRQRTDRGGGKSGGRSAWGGPDNWLSR